MRSTALTERVVGAPKAAITKVTEDFLAADAFQDVFLDEFELEAETKRILPMYRTGV